MQRARGTDNSTRRESGSSPEDEPEKDTASRFLSRRFVLPRADSSRKAGRPDPPDRQERIRRIKEEIRAGRYETKEKLDVAIRRLVDGVIGRLKR